MKQTNPLMLIGGAILVILIASALGTHFAIAKMSESVIMPMTTMMTSMDTMNSAMSEMMQSMQGMHAQCQKMMSSGNMMQGMNGMTNQTMMKKPEGMSQQEHESHHQ